MRRTVPKRPWALRALVAIAGLTLVQMGAGPAKKKGKEPPPPKVNETVGDLSFIVSHGEMRVQGVGLVVGLDGTGADPPTSWYRKQLVDEMSKAGVEKAEKLLANPHVSMVIVRLTIPIGVGPMDRLDAQVEVPPSCATTSLVGGYLLQTRLREVLIAGGTPKEGPEVALAQGPVMIGTPTKPNDAKVGRVLGGGRIKKDFPYTLAIKDNRKSFRTSRMLETIVNQRFSHTEDGHQKGVATAKTDSYLVLKVPSLYHQNQDHFFRVVQLLPVIDSPELRTRRIGIWGQELLDPNTAGLSAMKLEGMGNSAIEALKAGLKSTNAQVRFFSAESLAYLNDGSGVQSLGEIVIKEPEFRPYALAALAALDQPASHLKLRKLMDEPDIKTRYGAFNALRTLDPNDPFLGRVRVIDEPKPNDDDNDSPDTMAMAIVSASNRSRRRQEDPFFLYVVDSEGPPLIHVSRTRRPEIVIFGSDLRLLPPVVLDAGPIQLNAAVNDERIEVSKIVPSRFADGDMKTTTSLDLAEVVRRTANLGASYPEIVSILETASQRANLPGQLVVDAVPSTGRLYLEAVLGKDTSAKRDSAVKRAAAEASKPKRRWLFGFFARDAAEPTRDSTTPTTSTDAIRTPTQNDGQGGDPGRSAGDSKANTGTNGNAKKSDNSTDTETAKKDEALQKAGLDAPPPRWHLLDLFRRRDSD